MYLRARQFGKVLGSFATGIKRHETEGSNGATPCIASVTCGRREARNASRRKKYDVPQSNYKSAQPTTELVHETALPLSDSPASLPSPCCSTEQDANLTIVV
jgi:hypothetical protein